MSIALVKLVVAPFLIGGATLAARRWGPSIAGWLVGLPLTSGPVAFFVAVEQGIPFGLEVARSVLSGGVALCAFALVYARLSVGGRGPLAAAAGAGVTFIAVAGLIGSLPLPADPVLVAGVAVTLMVTLRLLPSVSARRSMTRPPRWDLAMRVVVGTTLIVGLTTVAPIVGPRASGLVSTFPVYVTTLTYFAHRDGGSPAVVAFQRGLVVGLFGWLAFWIGLLVVLPGGGLGPGFAVAIAAALIVQGLSLRVLGRTLPAALPTVGEIVP